MNQPPKTTLEYWVRFLCAMFVFGFLGFVGLLGLADEFSVTTLVFLWVTSTLTASMIAARVGDSAWGYLFRIFS